MLWRVSWFDVDSFFVSTVDLCEVVSSPHFFFVPSKKNLFSEKCATLPPRARASPASMQERSLENLICSLGSTGDCDRSRAGGRKRAPRPAEEEEEEEEEEEGH